MSTAPPPKKSVEERAAEAHLAAAVAQARERRYEARKPYEAATRQHVLFVREFHEHNTAVMRDPLMPAFPRVLAWARRYAWGEYSLFAIAPDGFPKFQVDCALELGLNKTTVSHAVDYGQRRGYLEAHPKLIIPAIAPLLTGPTEEGDAGSVPWKEFCSLWKVAYSTEFERLKVVEAEANAIRKVRLAEYKKFQASEKKRRASLLEIAREEPETVAGSPVSSPFQESLARGPVQKANPIAQEGEMHANAHAYLSEEIQRMQRAYPNSPFSAEPFDPGDRRHQNLIEMILQKLGSADEEDLIGYVVWVAANFKGIGHDAKGISKPRPPGSPSGPQGLGLLVNWAEDYARVAGLKPAARAKDAR